MERLKKRITSAGSACIACGVITLVVGLVTGIMMLVQGGKLLGQRSHCDLLREQLYGGDL